MEKVSSGHELHWHIFWPKANNVKNGKSNVVIPVCNVLSWWDISICKDSGLYPTQFKTYGSDTNLDQRQITQKMEKARVVIHVCDTWTRWDISIHEVSWLYTIQSMSYGPDMNFDQGQITQKTDLRLFTWNDKPYFLLIIKRITECCLP